MAPAAGRKTPFVCRASPVAVRREIGAQQVPSGIPHVAPILRQIVRNLVPGRFRAHENVDARSDRGGIDQGSHGDMDPFSLAHPGIKQRATAGAVGVMGGLVAEDEALIFTMGDAQLVLGYSGKRLEGGAGWCGGNSSSGSSPHRRMRPQPHSARRGSSIRRSGYERSNSLIRSSQCPRTNGTHSHSAF
ncbi:hypothetical protein ACVWWR_003573 [Bradyrhizobium sp. LM3.2]